MFSNNKILIKPHNQFILGFIGCSVGIISYVYKSEKNKKHQVKIK